MFIVLDLETTGLSPNDDAIIEFAFVKFDRHTGKEVDRLCSYVYPEREIPPLITQITGIFDTDVAQAPIFSDTKDQIEEFIDGLPLIGHNINFDLRFLTSHGINIVNNPVIDTFFLANFLVRGKGSLNLGYLCEYFSICLENAHRAIDDALATGELFFRLIDLIFEQDIWMQKVIVYYFSLSSHSGVKVLMDTFFSNFEDKLHQHEDIIELYLKVYTKNVPKKLDKYVKKEQANLHKFLSEIPEFELRESQKNMLDIVDKTLKQGSKTLVEAPTGIGKTFAYLLPAIQYSLSFGENVYVSTSTKALQDQIYYKDLRFLSKVYPDMFSFSKLKGKRNYFSLGAFLEFIEDIQDEKLSFILKILFWSTETEFGELDELEFYGEEFSYLSEIHAANRVTFDSENPYKDLEFIKIARENAKNANIVITNNNILFQDISSEGSLLGGVQNLIIDEAHNLEDIVTNSLKKNLSFSAICSVLEKIELKCVKKKVVELDIAAIKQQILFSSAELFSFFEGKIFEKFSLSTKYKNLLLQEAFFEENPEVLLLAGKVQKQLTDIESLISGSSEEIQKHFFSDLQTLASFKRFFGLFFSQRSFTENIYYVQHTEKKGLELYTTVLKPGDFLHDSLWGGCDSVVLTSATLRMQDSFDYIAESLHLVNFQFFSLPTDFDYSRQALLFIPKDLGSIKHNFPDILQFLEGLFIKIRGRGLVLFTAFSSIQEVYTKLKFKMQNQGVHLLAQNLGGSKHKQIHAFKKSSHDSILLGTDTFWEGVDIPGEDLKYLVIHKIPFMVPSDPIFQARSKLYKDPFRQYAIPKAVLKLRQGFGRLIRTKRDTGVVIFLDDRIYSTSWGEAFLAAFPHDIKRRYGSSKSLIEVLQGDESVNCKDVLIAGGE